MSNPAETPPAETPDAQKKHSPVKIIIVATVVVALGVVLLVVGLLTALLVPAAQSQRVAAIDSSVTSDVKNAATQVETWVIQNKEREVPSFTVAATEDGTIDNTATDPAFADMKVGENTTLTVEPAEGGAPGDYVIIGSNPNGEESVDDPSTPDIQEGITYISSANGLQ